MGKVGVLLIIFQFVTKITAFIRELILSNFYGAGSISDAYMIAMQLPVQLITVFSGFLTISFIPIYNRIIKEEGKESVSVYTSNLFNIIGLLTITLSVIIFIFVKPFVQLLALGFDEETLRFAVNFTKISIWGTIFVGITVLMTSYLQVHKRFLIPALGALPMSLAMIAGIILSKRESVYYLAMGTLAGYMLQAFFLIPSMRKERYHHKFNISLKNKYLKKMVVMSIPLIVATLSFQINFTIGRTIASTLEVGAISAMSYAERINSFVVEICIIPITTILFPLISKIIFDGDQKGLVLIVRRGISLISLLIFPIMMGGFILSREITGVLFFRGAFTEEALDLTSNLVFFNMMGLIGYAYKELFSLIFYSHGDTMTPVKKIVIGGIVNIPLSIFLAKAWGAIGLSIATSLTVTLQSILIVLASRKYLKKNDGSFMNWKNIFKIIIASILMGIIIIALKSVWQDQFKILTFLLKVAIGVGVYLILLFIFKIEELDYFMGELKIK